MIVHTHDYDSTYYPSMPAIEISLRRRVGQEPIRLKAIVDSGADATMVPMHHLNLLQLRRGQTRWLTGIAGGRYEVNLYTVIVQIGNQIPYHIEVVGTQNRDEVIVGRDIMNHYNFSLNAPAHTVEVSI